MAAPMLAPAWIVCPKMSKGRSISRRMRSGNHFKIVGRHNIFNQHGKLVAAQSRGRVLRAQRGTQTPGNRHQQYIARGVAQAVVDGLEFVEIEIEHAATIVRMAHAAGEREVQAVEKQRPVGQSREHIVHGVVLQLGFSLLHIADVAKREDIANLGVVHQQRRDLHAHIHKFAGLVGAHGFRGGASPIVDLAQQRGIFVQARFRDNQLAQAAAARLFGGVAKHAGECRIGVENVILMFDGDSFRKTGEHIFHQPRFGSSLLFAGMRHDDSFAQLRVGDAVGAFDRHEAAVGRGQRGVEGAAVPCAGQESLRLGRTGKESPQNIFDGTGDSTRPQSCPATAALRRWQKQSCPRVQEKPEPAERREPRAAHRDLYFRARSVLWPPEEPPAWAPS